jgi:hypothetical protein
MVALPGRGFDSRQLHFFIMENNVKITFWLNKTKKNPKNLVPVYLRVTQNYDHFTKATGIGFHQADWDKKAMRIRGANPEAITNNAASGCTESENPSDCQSTERSWKTLQHPYHPPVTGRE